MKNAFIFFMESRKAFIALTSVIGVVLVTLAGVARGLKTEAILGLLVSITSLSWKLLETIASEDNSKRALGEVYVVKSEEAAPPSCGDQNPR